MVSKEKINITFVLPSLVAGGAERVISLIANNLNTELFTPTLLIIGYEKDSTYPVDNIDVVYLNKPRVAKGFKAMFAYLIKNPADIVVSCMTHVNIPVAMVLKFLPKTKFVIREANIKKETAIYHPQKKSWLKRKMLKNSHQRSDKIICQSMDMAREMESLYHIPSQKIVVINNPISDEFQFETERPQNEIPHYITVGRLHREKGHERILNCLAQLDFQFHYTIIGSGEENLNLQNQVKKLNLEQQVDFIEYTDEVVKFLMQSDLFLQGSYAEGFPNALLESCAVGTAVLAFEASGGTREIVQIGVNGFLAKNETEFVEYLKRINENNTFNSKTVSDSVHKKFNKDSIIKQYETVFLQLIDEKA